MSITLNSRAVGLLFTLGELFSIFRERQYLFVVLLGFLGPNNQYNIC